MSDRVTTEYLPGQIDLEEAIAEASGKVIQGAVDAHPLFQTETIAGEQLKAFIERIERLDAEIKDLQQDRKEILAEAKGNGFDTKIIQKIIRLRAQDYAARQEEAAILELYAQAIGLAV